MTLNKQAHSKNMKLIIAMMPILRGFVKTVWHFFELS